MTWPLFCTRNHSDSCQTATYVVYVDKLNNRVGIVEVVLMRTIYRLSTVATWCWVIDAIDLPLSLSYVLLSMICVVCMLLYRYKTCTCVGV